MSTDLLSRGFLYLSLTVVGVPGNVAVISAFLLVYHQERRLLPADAIVLHLACANLLVVGVRCLLEVLASFYLSNVFSDTGCKAVIYVYRTARSLSIWLTFVLSAYQCLSIAPPGSRWAAARDVVAHSLGLVFLSVWIINTVFSTPSVLFAVGKEANSSSLQNSINVEFCHVRFPSIYIKDVVGASQAARDAVPMILMTLASLVILGFLYRHSQQVKSLRGGGAEQRAAKVVVTLVTVYVLFYGVDNALWVYTLTVKKAMASAYISDLRIFFSSLYAAVSPMVIIASNRKVKGRLRCVVQEKMPEERATSLSTI